MDRFRVSAAGCNVEIKRQTKLSSEQQSMHEINRQTKPYCKRAHKDRHANKAQRQTSTRAYSQKVSIYSLRYKFSLGSSGGKGTFRGNTDFSGEFLLLSRAIVLCKHASLSE